MAKRRAKKDEAVTDPKGPVSQIPESVKTEEAAAVTDQSQVESAPMTVEENEALKTELEQTKKTLRLKDRMLRRVSRAEMEVEEAHSEMESLRVELAEAQKFWKTKVGKLQAAVKDASKSQPTLPGIDDDDDDQPGATAANKPTPTGPAEDLAKGWSVAVLEPSQLREKINKDHAGISQSMIDKLVDGGVGTIGLLESRMQANPDWWWKDLKGVGKGGKDKVIDALQALRAQFPQPAAEGDEFILDEKAKDAGYQAAKDQIARQQCPYPTSGMQGRSWLIGWDEATTGVPYKVAETAKSEPGQAEQAAIDKATAEGREARLSGVPVANCPHKDGTKLCGHWMSGWQAADDEAKQVAAKAEEKPAESTPATTTQPA